MNNDEKPVLNETEVKAIIRNFSRTRAGVHTPEEVMYILHMCGTYMIMADAVEHVLSDEMDIDIIDGHVVFIRKEKNISTHPEFSPIEDPEIRKLLES